MHDTPLSPQSHHQLDWALPGRPVLTKRQRQALQLVSDGLCTKEIAELMGISLAGAKKHIEALRRLYAASNNAQLIRRAFECGELTTRAGSA
jgi:DNA-binding CsgD family transcriptional regulator